MIEQKEIFKALLKFQSECPKIKKDNVNPFFKSNYAGLPGIWEIVQPILANNGLIVIQPIRGKEICTTLIHSSGETIESNCPIISKSETNPQDFGSAITYTRRYSLSSLLGIVTEDDDDGNSASDKKSKPVSNTHTEVKKEEFYTGDIESKRQAVIDKFIAGQTGKKYETLTDKLKEVVDKIIEKESAHE